jgi:hypothetical protein
LVYWFIPGCQKRLEGVEPMRRKFIMKGRITLRIVRVEATQKIAGPNVTSAGIFAPALNDNGRTG